MLASQRRTTILDLVEEAGGAKVADLVGRLGVSDMTIRRDIERLAQHGLVERVHGGALAMGRRSSEEPGFTAKSRLQIRQKVAIARAGAAFVQPGASIGISAGTTTFELARCVRDVPDLTVVTNSVPVAQLLHESGTPGQTVVLVGGGWTPSDALVGPVAVTALRTLHVDWLFLGAHGVDLRVGLTTPNLVEAETNRALMDSARRVCVLADSSKLGIIGLSSFGELSDIDLLVTDSRISDRGRDALREAVNELIVVNEPTAEPLG